VTGKILFSFNSKLYYVEELHRRYPEHFGLLKLTHILSSLTFGEVSEHVHILLRFGANEHTDFDLMRQLDDHIYAKDNERMDYFYFLKLVPHVFDDLTIYSHFQSYSYSFNHNSKQS